MCRSRRAQRAQSRGPGRRASGLPRYVETQRVSLFTFRSADIGVVFDMMIHDIDVTLSMIHEPVAGLTPWA